MTEQITMDEWQHELEKCYGSDDGLTIREIAKMSERSERTTRKMVRKGIAAGRYIKGMALRVNRINRKIRVPVYRVVK